ELNKEQQERADFALKLIPRLSLLVQNDRGFADGYMALGDQLANAGDLYLAFLCFTRAIELEHPNDPELRRRRRELIAVFAHGESKRSSSYSAYMNRKVEEGEEHLKLGDRWLGEFQKVEAQLVKSGKMPSFEESEAAASKAGVRRYRPGGKNDS
ncbi:MAG: hypothetical protein AAF585_19020, partial [Verrucomicrobiota bacterium]